MWYINSLNNKLNIEKTHINGDSNLKYDEDIKRIKNLKITPNTHKILKQYCEEHGLKMFAFVEKLIKDQCKNLLTFMVNNYLIIHFGFLPLTITYDLKFLPLAYL